MALCAHPQRKRSILLPSPRDNAVFVLFFVRAESSIHLFPPCTPRIPDKAECV